MLSSKSLRINFLVKLTAAMAVLVALFSFILYGYISFSVDRELRSSLIKQARYLFANYPDLETALKSQKPILRRTLNIKAEIRRTPSAHYQPMHIVGIHRKGRYYLQAYFPYDFRRQSYLILTADVTQQKRVQQKVFRGIIGLNILAMVLIILYAFFLSKMLIAPIRYFSEKLARMNENILEPMDLSRIPDEFRPLGRSINQLVSRIKSFLHYKKELFVGTAHELKTPLAVMKTKSQVALMKRHASSRDLTEALRQNIDSIDTMNRIIGSILEFGRAEGAQFEKPRQMDLIPFLEKKAEEFTLLAESEGKVLHHRFSPQKLEMKIQPLLLSQILQNLLQNALRFTPEGHQVKFTSFLRDSELVIKIRDEGPGIDESVDLFAPFRRSKESPGAGLGLFLVKSAADALGASVTLQNRKDRRGTVATIRLPVD